MAAFKYTYQIAWFRTGPGAPVGKASNATVLLYALTDPTFTTPIPTYSDAALTTLVDLVADADGLIGVDFYTDNHPDVLWKSGTNNGQWATSQSRPGLRGPVSTTPGPPGPPGAAGTPGLNGTGLIPDIDDPGFYILMGS